MPDRDWDDAYANMAHIPGSEALPQIWAADASAYRRDASQIESDIPYGEHPRMRFDLIWPEGPPKGLAVFVHGGYWVALDKSYWTHFAEGARSKGWAVALPSYVLAPEARIGQITQQIGRAIAAAAARVTGPIRLAGHSAGGHLVSRMACADGPLPEDLKARLAHVLSISGLADLRPLMWTRMNADLGLDEAEAQTESPILQRPADKVRLTAWVGGGERPEFIRQARLLPMIWAGLGATTDLVMDEAHDHFSVLNGLREADSPITRAFVG